MKICDEARILSIIRTCTIGMFLVLTGCEMESDDLEWDTIDRNATSIEDSEIDDDAALTTDDDSIEISEVSSAQHSQSDFVNSEHVAFNFFREKGLTRIQAAGIIGNLMQESSVNPMAREFGGGPGRGVAQWSIGGRWNHDRLSGRIDNVVAYAKLHHFSRWELDLQLKFIWYELANFPTYGLRQLRRADTVRSAVLVFQNQFEICGGCDTSKRVMFARQALEMF